METPEMEFLQYLLRRDMEASGIDVASASIQDLLNKLQEDLTPIGGG